MRKKAKWAVVKSIFALAYRAGPDTPQSFKPQLNKSQMASKKVKGKDRLWVLQHCCLEAYCTLTQMSSFIHLQRRCTHQVA